MNNFVPIVVCADVGSVAKGNFGWWASTGDSGDRPSTLSRFIANSLSKGEAVAVGFECPLFVPLHDDETRLTSARPGEGSRAWSAGAGCGALATGLVQVAWILSAIRRELQSDVPAFLNWVDFVTEQGGLFIWEAFVSGASKGSSHISDARLGAQAFYKSLPNPEQANAVTCTGSIYSLVGAALLRSGWNSDTSVLEQACLVVKAEENAL